LQRDQNWWLIQFPFAAQYWYDMLDLPEKTEDFDYGLKTAIKNMTDDLNNR